MLHLVCQAAAPAATQPPSIGGCGETMAIQEGVRTDHAAGAAQPAACRAQQKPQKDDPGRRRPVGAQERFT
ncbi:hypothetical protein, partial [Klebsiella aerogenes]|uniref:hypothetical protein n=1 Tax=Klebsiella aerogenes TaxID=548 RepID=UPI0019548D5E